MEPEPTAACVLPAPEVRPSLSAEARFARVLEALPVALVLTGPGGRIEMANRRAEHMFGYDSGELRCKPLELLLAECFRGGHTGLGRRFLADMSPGAMGDGCDQPGLRKDGTAFPLEIGLGPIDLDGEPMMLASIIDVSARHESERQQEQKQRELERCHADFEEFVHAASHDLNAPLRAIGNLAQWIGEDIAATATPDTIDNLRLLQARVARLQMLLDGLLNYARIGHRTLAAPEDVDIAEMVRDIVVNLAPPPGFVVACEGSMPVIRTDRAPLRVVLENLIGNGLKHHDRSEGRITVAMRLVDGVAEFRVGDDGPGISPRFHERIFVIFQTLTSRDEVEASGAGLAIVKKIVQNHGGRIRVESDPPTRGSSFVFTWQETAP
jgi:PAS domain S-box-containing protein